MTDLDKEKLFFTIGEVSSELNLDQHVLRFWEKQFKQISPTKNNNRRLYRKSDIEVIKKIQDLLYNKGFTIKGVQKYLESRSDKQNINPNELTDTIKSSIDKLKKIQNKLQLK